MKKKPLFLLIACFLLSGCMLINSAYVVSNSGKKSFRVGRAYVLMGLSFGEDSTDTVVSASFVQYNPVAKEMIGDCMFLNKFGTYIKKDEGKETQYFLYDVPSGYWAYSGYNRRPVELSSENGELAVEEAFSKRLSEGFEGNNNDYKNVHFPPSSVFFEIPPQQVVYVGTYVLSSHSPLKVEFNIEEAKRAVEEKGLSPNKLMIAELIETQKPGIVICSP